MGKGKLWKGEWSAMQTSGSKPEVGRDCCKWWKDKIRVGILISGGEMLSIRISIKQRDNVLS